MFRVRLRIEKRILVNLIMWRHITLPLKSSSERRIAPLKIVAPRGTYLANLLKILYILLFFIRRRMFDFFSIKFNVKKARQTSFSKKKRTNLHTLSHVNFTEYLF